RAEEVYNELIKYFPTSQEAGYAKIQLQDLEIKKQQAQRLEEKTVKEAQQKEQPPPATASASYVPTLVGLASIVLCIGVLVLLLVNLNIQSNYMERVMLGQNYLSIKNPKVGLLLLKEAMDIDKKNFIAYKIAADYYLKTKNYNEAREVLEKYVVKNKKNKLAKAMLYGVYNLLGIDIPGSRKVSATKRSTSVKKKASRKKTTAKKPASSGPVDKLEDSLLDDSDSLEDSLDDGLDSGLGSDSDTFDDGFDADESDDLSDDEDEF
ncbi:tetratricopeptide repeat protein, partial [Spirochaetota bacterium]